LSAALLASLALAAGAAAGAQAGAPAGAQASTAREASAEGCAVCHGEQAVALARSVHADAGFACTTCHGGDPLASEAELAHGGDFRPLTGPVASVTSCGECHADPERMRVTGLRSDPLALYRTSRHGQALFESGDAQVATCADCHGSHAILHSSDPVSSVHPRNQAATCGACHADAERMEPYGLAHDVVERYADSVHSRAMEQDRTASPSCSDCHGAHGALPPGVDQAAQVCGHCHGVPQADYERSAHVGLDPPVQCVTCHGDHGVLPASTEALAGPGPGSCVGCHADADDPARRLATAMHAELVELEESIADTVAAARRSGVGGGYLYDELGFLSNARGILVRARTRTHATSMEELESLLVRGRGLVSRTEESLERLSRRDRDRRIFTVLFFLVSLALAVMLWMNARELRGPLRRGAASRPPGAGGGEDGDAP